MQNYEVLELLGAGGFGEVRRCRSIRSGNFFAMKTAHSFPATEDLRCMFERELVLQSGLKHDNVVKLLTEFNDGGRLYAVFELLERSIIDELEVGGWSGLESLKIKKYSFQTLRGLDFIHSRHIMHRDIKPDNLLVSPSGVVKLADFGSTHMFDNASMPLTQGEGTLWYSAPEMLVRDPRYNKPVDVWAFGCTLAFMARGEPLLMGKNFPMDQIQEIVTKVGPLTATQQQYFSNLRYTRDLPVVLPSTNLVEKYDISDPLLAELVEACLQMDPVDRLSCSALLGHPYFTQDHFHESFPKELEKMVDQDQSDPLIVEQKNEPTQVKEKKNNMIRSALRSAMGKFQHLFSS